MQMQCKIKLKTSTKSVRGLMDYEYSWWFD